MEITVEPNKMYAVTTSGSCTVVDADGLELCTASSGQQSFFVATTSTVTISDDSAKVSRANFKRAALALRLLGGGDNLPAGYTRLDFLESTGSQYIDTGLTANQASAFRVDCEINANSGVVSGAVFGAQNGGVYQDRAGWSEYTAGTQGWLFWGWTSESTVLPTPPTERHRVELSQTGLYYNGSQLRNLSGNNGFRTSGICWLFARNRPDTVVTKYHGKIYSFNFSQDGKPQLNFVPVLDPTGTPCMYDTVSKQAFKNDGSGQFIAGFTLAQAAQLGRKLPSTGGSLTVSLPEGYEQDERVVESLTQAEAKGWVLTIQTYAAEAAAATFALRRVWVRRQQDENGSYVAADGSLWQVDWCVDVIGADPEELGYERFRSVDAATEYWGLMPYVDPAELSTEA